MFSNSDDLDLTMIKKYCKQNKCSVNTYCLGLIGTSLYELFRRKEHGPDGKHFPIPESQYMSQAVSMREPVKSIDDANMSNEVTGFGINLKLSPDITQVMDSVKQ